MDIQQRCDEVSKLFLDHIAKLLLSIKNDAGLPNHEIAPIILYASLKLAKLGIDIVKLETSREAAEHIFNEFKTDLDSIINTEVLFK